MKTLITEGKAKIEIFRGEKISKDLPVFYNPKMALNRDISVLLLKASGKKNMRIADILAGSGVRSIRFLKELGKGVIESISLNDGSKEAVALIKKNLALNKLHTGRQIVITQKDANVALLESTGFDYIEIDPFGSPVPFLDASMKRISGDGILAVTATDTAPLCGTYPKTCRRRYWSTPKKCGMMHELGIRILIRHAQLISTQYEKALFPIFCYAHEHYFRAFFRCERGNAAVDAMLRQHGMLDGAGPLWLGPLWDKPLVKKMKAIAKKQTKSKNEKSNELLSLLEIISREMEVSSAGFYDIHELAKQTKHNIPSKVKLISAITKAGHLASGTHFKGEGIRSIIPKQELIELMKK